MSCRTKVPSTEQKEPSPSYLNGLMIKFIAFFPVKTISIHKGDTVTITIGTAIKPGKEEITPHNKQGF